MTWKGVWDLLKTAFTGFMDDKVPKLSGALAYFTVFSIGPMQPPRKCISGYCRAGYLHH